MGGEHVLKKSAKKVNECAFEDAHQPLNVLVFPWARASFDNKYRRRKLLFDYFVSLGASTVNFVEYSNAQSIMENLAFSSLLYFTGGQPSILVERLKKTGVYHLLENYKGIVVGRSAGALALCRSFVATCRSNSKVKIINGLGLVDITLKVHYTPEKDEMLKRFSLNKPVFAVPENSALIYDNGELSAMGEVYFFDKGEKKAFTKTVLRKEPADINL